jgi:hypothetical protein
MGTSTFFELRGHQVSILSNFLYVSDGGTK